MFDGTNFPQINYEMFLDERQFQKTNLNFLANVPNIYSEVLLLLQLIKYCH